MKNPNDFENLTIRQILVELLGERDAEAILQTIQKAIMDHISGDDLMKVIHAKLCELKVTNIEVYEILHIAPHVVGPQITPK